MWLQFALRRPDLPFKCPASPQTQDLRQRLVALGLTGHASEFCPSVHLAEQLMHEITLYSWVCAGIHGQPIAFRAISGGGQYMASDVHGRAQAIPRKVEHRYMNVGRPMWLRAPSKGNATACEQRAKAACPAVCSLPCPMACPSSVPSDVPNGVLGGRQAHMVGGQLDKGDAAAGERPAKAVC